MPTGESAVVHITCYTDPGCSWAWGSEPKLRRLDWELGHRLAWRYVMGGLVGNMDVYAPGLTGEALAQYWRGVSAHTGMPCPATLPRPYRSTDPACRAVKAAERQGQEVALRALRRLRESIFVFGRPTDEREAILEALRGLPGLDLDRLARDLDSPQVEEAYRADWEETRNPNQYVMNLEDDSRPGAGKARCTEGRWRYVFPTLIFRGPAGERTAPGWQPYEAYLEAMETVAPGSTDGRRPLPSPPEMLEHYGSATLKEIEVVCGLPPEEARAALRSLEAQGAALPWPADQPVLWMLPREARARGMA